MPSASNVEGGALGAQSGDLCLPTSRSQIYMLEVWDFHRPAKYMHTEAYEYRDPVLKNGNHPEARDQMARLCQPRVFWT